jgi:hypothetical protein
MSENTWEIPWAQVGQMKIEIESALRNKISEEISAYSQRCIDRGISNYFVSGLEVAANIAMFGPPQAEKQQEVLL